ncbi:MAG: ASKHA domain-containing protein [bacterium]
MAVDYTIDFQPLGRRVEISEGRSLLEAARKAGVGLNAVCGGAGICGTCRVRIVEGKVSPPNKSEEKFLDQREFTEGYRLACQVEVWGDVLVDVPPESITAPQRAQIEGRERPIEIDPTVRGFDVSPTPPNLHDLRSDEKRLREALRVEHGITSVRFDPIVLTSIPSLLRENDWEIRLFLRDGEVIGAARAGTPPLGLAVDIGTTKVAAYLVDLESGETLGASGEMNPQIAFGEDVMARIAYAMEGEEHGRELQEAIVGGLEDRARELCEECDRNCEEILEAVLVGNTCMHHLVMGLPVDQLGVAPYVPALSSSCDVKARDLELDIGTGAYVHLLPNIAGFVGADHVSMVMASGLHEADEITLGLDIGTNTEVSLAANGRLLSCSTASGPAFEGAHIRDGMRAAPGAIEWVKMVDGHIEYQTIDGMPPVGLCGSGILDSVAELRRIGVLQKNGSMRPDSHPHVRQQGDRPEFVLVPAGENGALDDIVINRKDVSEIQLAKGAIRAGVEVLLNEAEIEADQVERVVVAGAFGTYLDVANARAIGMFPALPLDRFDQVGNAAGIGAKLALVSRRFRDVAEEIARRVEYIELTTDARFASAYMDAMSLPDPAEVDV